MMANSIEADVEAVARIDAVPLILEVVSRTTGMGFAAVVRVTQDRWVACSLKDQINFGLKPGDELKVETTICHEVHLAGQPVVIDHVDRDTVYAGHHTPAMYGFQSYISMPIVRAGGGFFGTLCAIDPKPHRLNTPETIGMFKLFADLIAFHLDTVDRLASSEATLKSERETAELREQFIAVLGHDLRNPLGAIRAGNELLLRQKLEDRARQAIHLMEGSVARMSALIDNLLDFARGRLGRGLVLERAEVLLEPVLRQVTAEIRAVARGRAIDGLFDLDHPVTCDANRVGQLYSNLLANALTHGAADSPIRVTACSTADGAFDLSVANAGPPIPPEAMERLFQPFFRGGATRSQQGLGLGLYIAHEIAVEHGGTLAVASTGGEIVFTFKMPPSRLVTRGR
jgi:signal transduction histidine kinase